MAIFFCCAQPFLLSIFSFLFLFVVVVAVSLQIRIDVTNSQSALMAALIGSRKWNQVHRARWWYRRVESLQRIDEDYYYYEKLDTVPRTKQKENSKTRYKLGSNQNKKKDWNRGDAVDDVHGTGAHKNQNKNKSIKRGNRKKNKGRTSPKRWIARLGAIYVSFSFVFRLFLFIDSTPFFCRIRKFLPK